MRTRAIYSAAALSVVFSLLLTSCRQAPANPQPLSAANGRLTECDGLRVLYLWGAPEDVGYAQGYLLGPEILALFDDYVLDPAVGAAPQVYETQVRPRCAATFDWSAESVAELDGMLRGMRARLGVGGLNSKKLGREITVDDLKAVNALADWNGFACSSFSAWGTLTRDGQTITARNLDYPATDAMRRAQLVVIRCASEGRHGWAGVSWPGVIGAYTAMNDVGVTASVHDVAADGPPDAVGRTPRALVLREILERADAKTYVDDATTVLRNRKPLVGANVLVSAPVWRDAPGAVVFEYDAEPLGQGVTLRFDDGGDAVEGGVCCTNHLRLRSRPMACARFAAMNAGLKGCVEGAKLTTSAAAELIGRAAQDTTLHTVIFEPARRRMHVRIPSVLDQLTPIDLGERFDAGLAAVRGE